MMMMMMMIIIIIIIIVWILTALTFHVMPRHVLCTYTKEEM